MSDDTFDDAAREIEETVARLRGPTPVVETVLVPLYDLPWHVDRPKVTP